MLSAATIFFLAQILTTALAVRVCYISEQEIPGPPPEECLTIASHIPLVVDTTNTGAFNYPPSFPFFPRAYFVHRDCIVRISYASTDIPHVSTPGLLNALELRHLQTPVTPLSARSVSRIWRATRLAISNIARDCLANELMGSEWGLIDVPEIRNAWYLVEIWRTEWNIPLRQALEEERAALMGHDPDDTLSGHFEMPIWEVP